MEAGCPDNGIDDPESFEGCPGTGAVE